jgi:putative transposase
VVGSWHEEEKMTVSRKSFSVELKTKVALEAIRGQRTVAEIAGEYGIHPQQITQWKKHVLEGIPDLLSDKRRKSKGSEEDLVPQLYQQIGQLKVELDWLKKKSGLVR